MKTAFLAFALVALVGGLGIAVWYSTAPATTGTIYSAPAAATAPSSFGQAATPAAKMRPFGPRARTFGSAGASQWNSIDPENPSIPPQPPQP